MTPSARPVVVRAVIGRHVISDRQVFPLGSQVRSNVEWKALRSFGYPTAAPGIKNTRRHQAAIRQWLDLALPSVRARWYL